MTNEGVKNWTEEPEEICTDLNRCEDCAHCMRTRVCDACGCEGGCFEDCIYIVDAGDKEEEGSEG